MNMMAEKAKARQPSNFVGLKTVQMKVDDVFLERNFICNCGTEALSILAGKFEEEDIWLDPVSYICSYCNQKNKIFDSQTDGYDGLLCGGSASMQNNDQEIIKCPKCQEEKFKLKADIAYNINFDEPEEFEELDDEFKSRLSDLYDALSLSATCVACDNIFTIGDWELA